MCKYLTPNSFIMSPPFSTSPVASIHNSMHNTIHSHTCSHIGRDLGRHPHAARRDVRPLQSCTSGWRHDCRHMGSRRHRHRPQPLRHDAQQTHFRRRRRCVPARAVPRPAERGGNAKDGRAGLRHRPLDVRRQAGRADEAEQDLLGGA
jgi:hypothetical protein